MRPEIKNIPPSQCKKILSNLYHLTLEQARGSVSSLQREGRIRWITYDTGDGEPINVRVDRSSRCKEETIYTLFCSPDKAEELNNAGVIYSEPQKGSPVFQVEGTSDVIFTNSR